MGNQFQELFEKNHNLLCGIAYKILRDKDSAREIVQEVFIELWKRNDWRQLQSPKAYLCVAVYNRAINEFKRRKKFTLEKNIPQQSALDQHEFEYLELERMITKGIDLLPSQCKTIFLLSRECEMTYSAIASHLGLSIKTIERQMGIALQKLRKHMGSHAFK